jgi:hypothetical protein
VYVIRRVWDAHPGKARRAATIVAEIGKVYEANGRRGPSTVYFNSGTLPAEKNKVYMEWQDETISSPYGTGQPSIPELAPLSAELRELTDGSVIEFYELLTPAKALEA